MSSLQNFRYQWEAPGFPTHESTFGFSHCTQQPLSWMKELERAAVRIAESTKRPLWLCSSGGVDSETLCEIFLRMKIPFQVLTIEFADGKNSHDIEFAKLWCKAHRIAHKLYTIDIFDFVREEIEHYVAEGYAAIEPFRFMMMKEMEVVEEMGGLAVLAGGEQLFEVDAGKPVLTAADPYLSMDISYTTPLEFCRRNRLPHEPYFYFSAPEIMLAWQHIPVIDFVLRNPDFLRHPTNKHALKNSVIRYHFPEQQWRNKYHGFEQVQNLAHMAKAKLGEYFGDRIHKRKVYVQELQKQLAPVQK